MKSPSLIVARSTDATLTTASHGTESVKAINFMDGRCVTLTPKRVRTLLSTKNANARTGLESTNTKTSVLNDFCIKVDKFIK
jgi:hypothetical protein